MRSVWKLQEAADHCSKARWKTFDLITRHKSLEKVSCRVRSRSDIGQHGQIWTNCTSCKTLPGCRQARFDIIIDGSQPLQTRACVAAPLRDGYSWATLSVILRDTPFPPAVLPCDGKIVFCRLCRPDCRRTGLHSFSKSSGGADAKDSLQAQLPESVSAVPVLPRAEHSKGL